MTHVQIGGFFAVQFSVIAASLAALSLQPVPRFTELGADLAPARTEAPAAKPVELATVVILAEAPRPAARAKHKVCDRRGDTVYHGMAVARENRLAGENLATVCWWE
jgi:hypothetical protein